MASPSLGQERGLAQDCKGNRRLYPLPTMGAGEQTQSLLSPATALQSIPSASGGTVSTRGVAVAFLCGQQSLGRRKRTWVMAHGQGSPRRAADGRKVYQSQVSNVLCIPGASTLSTLWGRKTEAVPGAVRYLEARKSSADSRGHPVSHSLLTGFSRALSGPLAGQGQLLPQAHTPLPTSWAGDRVSTTPGPTPHFLDWDSQGYEEGAEARIMVSARPQPLPTPLF